MPATADQLFLQALSLSPEERADLTDWLVASSAEAILPKLEQVQLAEVRRRIARVEAGEAELIPGEQVLTEGRTLLRGHALIDARSLALGELTAQRLREQPEKLDIARAMLARWRRICAPNVQAVLAEWQTILDAGLEATIAVLTGQNERCVRLRQSAPFAGESIITREERNAIWKRFAP